MACLSVIEKNREVFGAFLAAQKGQVENFIFVNPSDTTLFSNSISCNILIIIVLQNDFRFLILIGLENEPGYPRIVKMTAGNELQITKSNFKEVLKGLLNEGFLAA